MLVSGCCVVGWATPAVQGGVADVRLLCCTLAQVLNLLTWRVLATAHGQPRLSGCPAVCCVHICGMTAGGGHA